MSDKDYLQWPFSNGKHRQLETELDAWATKHIAHDHGPGMDVECHALVKSLGQAGWLHRAVGGTAHGGVAETINTRAICLIRETLARHFDLANFIFAMQGLGSGAISSHGTPGQRERYLAKVARGEAIAAFVLSRPEAGSDVAAMACAARKGGANYVLDSEKTWVSNNGIADFYIVFARSGETPSSRGISVFIVGAGTPGFEIAERINVITSYSLTRLRLTNCHIPANQHMDTTGEGFKVTMYTLSMFRTPVAAAMLGLTRRTLGEALAHATTRKMFSGVLADFQLVRAKLTQVATAIDSVALLTYHVVWQHDRGRDVTHEAAMVKLTATENAQQMIDATVQIWGSLGVASEQPMERLHREIHSLRIHEGTTKVQQPIIARGLLRAITPSAH